MSKQELIARMRGIAEQMEELGTNLDYYGGMHEISEHGRELVGAAGILIGWADGWEYEE